MGKKKKFTHEVGEKKKIHPPKAQIQKFCVFRKKKFTPKRADKKKITSQPGMKKKIQHQTQLPNPPWKSNGASLRKSCHWSRWMYINSIGSIVLVVAVFECELAVRSIHSTYYQFWHKMLKYDHFWLSEWAEILGHVRTIYSKARSERTIIISQLVFLQGP